MAESIKNWFQTSFFPYTDKKEKKVREEIKNLFQEMFLLNTIEKHINDDNEEDVPTYFKYKIVMVLAFFGFPVDTDPHVAGYAETPIFKRFILNFLGWVNSPKAPAWKKLLLYLLTPFSIIKNVLFGVAALVINIVKVTTLFPLGIIEILSEKALFKLTKKIMRLFDFLKTDDYKDSPWIEKFGTISEMIFFGILIGLCTLPFYTAKFLRVCVLRPILFPGDSVQAAWRQGALLGGKKGVAASIFLLFISVVLTTAYYTVLFPLAIKLLIIKAPVAASKIAAATPGFIKTAGSFLYNSLSPYAKEIGSFLPTIPGISNTVLGLAFLVSSAFSTLGLSLKTSVYPLRRAWFQLRKKSTSQNVPKPIYMPPDSSLHSKSLLQSQNDISEGNSTEENSSETKGKIYDEKKNLKNLLDKANVSLSNLDILFEENGNTRSKSVPPANRANNQQKASRLKRSNSFTFGSK